ncbi:Cytochrome c5 [Marinomonas aquimarina]|uniref:Cytochrome c5 n=1 Tax=Marinomonas aquimarina TaxID=295068 RepID=A0A1A8T3F9_9GAMM|nr:cytochrome c5 family protein [Marinomonas aquimarina]SBS25600.1 Cytochrome c5 [Marinomonas aquimarina]
MSSLIKSIHRKLFTLISIAGFSAVMSSSVSAIGQTPDDIAARIAPIGNVCVAGEECEVASAAAVASNDGPRSGEAVYNQFCTACHSVGVAGAPKLGSASDWAPRVANGFDSLMSNAINGLNAMPPRGTCSTCSDDEIQAAIEYMLDNSK